MSALRRALHQCADLLADAFEEDAARPHAPPTNARTPRKRRAPRAPAPIPDLPMSDEVRTKAEFHARKHGLV